MNALLFLTATAALGVDVGWQPLDGGGFEYIIQIPPDQVASLTDGFEITSDVPPLYRGIRTYRIIVGNGPLPRAGAPPLPVSNPPREGPTDVNVDASVSSADSTQPPVLPDNAQLPADAVAQRAPNDNSHDGSSLPPDIARPREHSTGYGNQTAAGGQSDPSKDVKVAGGQQDRQEPDTVADAWEDDTVTAKSEKPWLAFSATLLGLFGSIGLNGYLGWIFMELRGRHRRLLVTRIDDAALSAS